MAVSSANFGSRTTDCSPYHLGLSARTHAGTGRNSNASNRNAANWSYIHLWEWKWSVTRHTPPRAQWPEPLLLLLPLPRLLLFLHQHHSRLYTATDWVIVDFNINCDFLDMGIYYFHVKIVIIILHLFILHTLLYRGKYVRWVTVAS